MSLRKPRWRHPELQPGWIDRPHQTLALGELSLEGGEAIRDFEISYVVHGTRSRGDDNVILVLTAVGSRQLDVTGARSCCACRAS